MVLSASFTRQLMEFATHWIGKYGFGVLIGFVLLGTATLFFITEVKRLVKPIRILLMLALFVSASFFIWNIKLPQVRMHILLYAVVGWLASRDAMKSGSTGKTIITAWLFAATAGALEEVFQKMLPYRVFDVADMLYNIEGATLGVVLYSL